MADESDGKSRKKRGMLVLIIALLVCCVVALGASLFFFLKYQETQNSEATANSKAVERVSQTIKLPDETPVVVTVADKDKLTNKQLATKLENGDVMLIFAKAKRLVVFRPSIDKIADVLSFSDPNELPKSK